MYEYENACPKTQNGAESSSDGPLQVVLASPRSFCAGVVRAVEIVEAALQRFGPPVYVRRQIVHNSHVVSALAVRGALFVEELDEVPHGEVVVLSAHGVAPSVREQAIQRGLTVIDATCPLVAKVHAEARRFQNAGRRIVLIGHRGHEEIEGTMGEAEEIHLVESADQVAELPFASDDPVGYLTQTTLATDEVASIVEALKERFADLTGPPTDDICYASQNRQDAIRLVAQSCQVVIVVGSHNSSNSARLVEVAERQGCRGYLIEDAAHLEEAWIQGVRSVGVTAGASAPEDDVQAVVDRIFEIAASHGRTVQVREQRAVVEDVRFALPAELRQGERDRAGRSAHPGTSARAFEPVVTGAGS
jgi:4-hydroxy-3-methylbut-2-enyl diphosphate reductase